MKLRLGQTGSRFSTDFDLARRGEYSDFLDDLDSKLAAGWAGFTGQAVRRPPPRPAGVPTSYVMQPLEIKLQYRGRSWLTILMEVGHDELDDTVDSPLRLTDELRNLVVALGLPARSRSRFSPSSIRWPRSCMPVANRVASGLTIWSIYSFSPVSRTSTQLAPSMCVAGCSCSARSTPGHPTSQ